MYSTTLYDGQTGVSNMGLPTNVETNTANYRSKYYLMK